MYEDLVSVSHIIRPAWILNQVPHVVNSERMEDSGRTNYGFPETFLRWVGIHVGMIEELAAGYRKEGIECLERIPEYLNEPCSYKRSSFRP